MDYSSNTWGEQATQDRQHRTISAHFCDAPKPGEVGLSSCAPPPPRRLKGTLVTAAETDVLRAH